MGSPVPYLTADDAPVRAMLPGACIAQAMTFGCGCGCVVMVASPHIDDRAERDLRDQRVHEWGALAACPVCGEGVLSLLTVAGA